jgi:hypothetical protein
MSILLKTLKLLHKDAELVDLYRDRLDDESLTGIVTAFSDDFIYLSLFSDSGLCNGISVVRISDITRVRWEGNERISIQQLVDKKGTKPLAPELNLSTMQSVIKSVQSIFGYVNLLTEEMDSGISFIGKVIEIDDSHILFNGYGTMTSRDKNKMLIDLSEITRVDADAPYEKDIVYLATKSS